MRLCAGLLKRVCRVHGAGGGHKAGPSHPQWKHGMRSVDMVELRRLSSYLNRAAKEHEQANLPCRFPDLHGLVRISAMRTKLPSAHGQDQSDHS